MVDDPKLKQALALIVEAIDDAYKRGRADAISAMIEAASGEMNFSKPKKLFPEEPEDSYASPIEEGRVRAPRGSAERVIRRAIAAEGDNGVTLAQIMAAREGDLEMMLVDSSIRGELRRGAREVPPKYQEINGRWYIDPV